MKALIIKDLLMLRKSLKIVAVMMVFYIILFMLTGSAEALPLVLTILAVTFSISTFNFDEANKWDRYALSGPLLRQDIVRAKYALTLLLTAAALLLSLLCMALLSLAIPLRSWAEILLIMSIEILIGLLDLAAVLPFIYKLGAEKGRLLLIPVLMIPFLAIVLIGKFAPPQLMLLLESYLRYLPALLGLVAAAGYYLSYRISLRIYLGKDF
jgi:hypothetical protein